MRLNLTKKDLINAVYMQIGYSKKISETLIDDFFEIILDNLITNKKVKIAKFGTFILKKKSPRIGRKTKTKEETIINERNVITFKASREFKKFINQK